MSLNKGGDFLIKVGMDVQRVQDQGQENFSKKPNDQGSFLEPLSARIFQ